MLCRGSWAFGCFRARGVQDYSLRIRIEAFVGIVAGLADFRRISMSIVHLEEERRIQSTSQPRIIALIAQL